MTLILIQENNHGHMADLWHHIIEHVWRLEYEYHWRNGQPYGARKIILRFFNTVAVRFGNVLGILPQKLPTLDWKDPGLVAPWQVQPGSSVQPGWSQGGNHQVSTQKTRLGTWLGTHRWSWRTSINQHKLGIPNSWIQLDIAGTIPSINGWNFARPEPARSAGSPQCFERIPPAVVFVQADARNLTNKKFKYRGWAGDTKNDSTDDRLIGIYEY